jgi:hypothetical protein
MSNVSAMAMCTNNAVNPQAHATLNHHSSLSESSSERKAAKEGLAMVAAAAAYKRALS